MEFVKGNRYTRQEIHGHLEGETDSYLPQKRGKIVCACLTPDLGPDAPRTVLVGDGEQVRRKADLLDKQGGTLPVFLKRDKNAWEYQGVFRVVGSTEDPVTLTEHRTLSGRENLTKVIFLEPVASSTYLLAWNPTKWEWVDLENMVQATIENRRAVDTWSTGVTKRVQPGDRLFLVHLGREPRGIMGSGFAISGVKEGPHWDKDRADAGGSYLYANVSFDHLLNPKYDAILGLDELKTAGLASVNWTPQASGIEIKSGLELLERLWNDHIGVVRPEADVAELSAIEGEVRLMMIRHRSRERTLRDAKIADYKSSHGDRLPCEACGLDFLETYGEIGRDFAHVHHDRPLGSLDEPTRTALSDLRIVCANCHAMIHRGGQARSIDSLLVAHKNEES